MTVTLAPLSRVAPASAAPFGAVPDNAVAAAEPGQPFGTRSLRYHVAGVETPVRVMQVAYRSTDARGRPSTNITSLLLPPGPAKYRQAVAYNSFYDSLDPAHSPSRSIQGDVSFGGVINNLESTFVAPLLLQGFPVIVTDTQGQRAHFAAGPEYGTNTLDAIRAVSRVRGGLHPDTRIALMGYSGGSIATNWAAALAPKYAPDVDRRLVGATGGGLLVSPGHNLRYVSGSIGWSGVAVMAIDGVARAYGIDMSPYLSARGVEVTSRASNASILDVLFRYPGLTWADLVKPRYRNPSTIGPFVDAVNKIDLSQAPTPNTPLLMVQGARGELEGSDGTKPGIGPGDGVMIAGDVRSLMRSYCASGNSRIRYLQLNGASHQPATAVWLAESIRWINDRFAGVPAPTDCGRIAPGNSLTPMKKAATR
ncbi:lipase family protein [Gordonia sihwensis]|uniref:lipase family protein n=1 Tax=Gordonia sihwensis TaxID=173559 RepID=UPI001E2835F0|nr:lipase family protein [Gordonia sihwensis]